MSMNESSKCGARCQSSLAQQAIIEATSSVGVSHMQPSAVKLCMHLIAKSHSCAAVCFDALQCQSVKEVSGRRQGSKLSSLQALSRFDS